jgi:hypothetical protein
MQRIKNLVFTFLFIFTSINIASACDCSPYGNIYYQLNYAYQSNVLLPNKHIVLGVALDIVHGYGMGVKILNQYYGVHNLPDTLIIWGDAGNTCRFSPVGYYHVGDTMLTMVSLVGIDGGVQTSYESPADYSISDCFFDYMIVRNDSVLGGGNIGNWTNTSLPNFLDSLNTILTAPVLGINATGLHAGNYVYPNPAHGLVTIQMPRSNTQARMRVYDMNGRAVLQQELHLDEGKATVSILLPPGVYALQLTDDKGFMETERLVIYR